VERFKKSRGSITVFLSLLMAGVLTVSLAITELSRTALLRGNMASDCGNAMTSALAEYNRPLLGQYNIFGLDVAYGQASFNEGKLVKRMREYMPGLSGGLGPGLGYEDEKIVTDNYSFLTDDYGEEVYRQAVSYMKKKYGIDIVSNLLGLSDDASKLEKQKESLEKVKGKSLGDAKPGGIFKSIDSLRTKGVLSLVLGPGSSASGEKVDSKDRLSVRRKDLFAASALPKQPLTSRLLFDQYILKTFSSYKTADKSSGLKYEVEFILAGNNDDKSNLAKVVDKLVLIREAANFAYIHTDAVKKGEVTLLATAALAVTANPVIIKVAEELILAAWAYAESICDVRTLLQGGKVPLIKSAATWHTGIGAIASPGTSGVLHTNTGLTYEDYLHVLLFLQNDADKCLRTMEIMEMGVRKTAGYENFRMENCICGFSMQAVFKVKPLFGGYGSSQMHYGGAISYEALEKGS